jgi:mRNA interferase YafQ
MNQQPYYEYTLKQSSQFKKDLKAVKFDEHKLEELKKVLDHLGCTGEVPSEYQPHPLKGQFKNCMECHIEDDFLLIWKDPEQKVIRLIRLGSHSKLFDKQRRRNK